VRQSPAEKNMRMEAEDIVRIHHQAMTGEDNRLRDLVCPIVIYEV
jgi:hypothetical protein